MPAAFDIRASHDQWFSSWLTNPDTLTTARPSGNNITAGIPWVHVDFDGHTTGPTEVNTASRYATTNSGYTLDQRRQVLEDLDSAYAPFNVRFTTDPNPFPGAGAYAGKLLIGATIARNGVHLSGVPGIARSNSFGGTIDEVITRGLMAVLASHGAAAACANRDKECAASEAVRPDRLMPGDVWEFEIDLPVKGRRKPIAQTLQWQVIGWHAGQCAWELKSINGEHVTYLMEFAPQYEEMIFVRKGDALGGLL